MADLQLLRNRPNWNESDEVGKSGIKIGAKEQTLFVYDVTETSVAFAAGIRKGDRIVSINGSPLDEEKIFVARQILSRKQGEQVTMEIVRDGTRMEKSFQLGADPLP